MDAQERAVEQRPECDNDAVAFGRGHLRSPGPRLFGPVEHVGGYDAADGSNKQQYGAMRPYRPIQSVSARKIPRAFTLIEVMLALAVSAIVLAAIRGGFYSAMRLREAQSAM